MPLLPVHNAASFWRGTLPVLLRRSLPLTVILLLLSEALSTLLVLPLMFRVLDLLIGLSGNTVVANVGIISFARSPGGILASSVGLIGWVFVELAQLAALSVINIRSLAQQPTSLYGVVRVVVTKSGALFRTALVLAAVVVAVGLPLVALAGLTYWLLLSGADINYFLSTWPPPFLLAVAIAGVLILIGLIILAIAQVGFIFVAPLVMFEGSAGVSALRTSYGMVQGHRWPLFWALLRWFCIALIIMIVGLLLVSASFSLLAPGPNTSPTAFAISLAVLFLMTIVVGVFLQVVPAFLHAALISHLYVEHRALAGHVTLPDLRQGLDANAHHVLNRKLGLGMIGAITFFTFVFAGLVGLGAQTLLMRPDIMIMAHRAGAAGAPENSLTALRRTIAQGIATYAEIDVQETADGVVVVIHDSDLRRLANVNARVWDLSLAQIEQVDIGSKVGPQFAGERIPTFDAFLDTAKGKIKLNIELKYDRDAPLLAGKVVDLIRAKGMQNDVVISSLDSDALKQVRQLAPELKVGLIYQIELGSIDRLDVDFLEPEASRVTSALMDAADVRGLPVYAWTIDDRASAQQMYDAGVSAVITNNPLFAQHALDERRALSDTELIMARFRELFTP